jgi:hypothetical protein
MVITQSEASEVRCYKAGKLRLRRWLLASPQRVVMIKQTETKVFPTWVLAQGKCSERLSMANAASWRISEMVG